jgi:predicted nucleic acid-binding protein
LIADSSALIVFARAQRLDILFGTLGNLGITREVEKEAMGTAVDRPDAQTLADALRRGRLKVVPAPPSRVAAIVARYPNLGRGEASVIAAALQVRERTVLLDERAARRAATLEGLQAVGSLGVLARAHRMGVLKSRKELAEAVRDILAAGLWVAPDVVEAFWEGVGGRS